MKIVEERYFIKTGDFHLNKEFLELILEVKEAIKLVTWPIGNKKFIINPKAKSNGVKPIKANFLTSLKGKGWHDEKRLSLMIGVNPGPIDVVKETSHGLFAVEWETGNISSSHRALNKMACAIIQKQIIGGILIIPARSLAKFLTDRIGNYEEIAPYFCLFENLIIPEGVLGIISIEHDSTSSDVPLIPKGKDGNSKKKEKKAKKKGKKKT